MADIVVIATALVIIFAVIWGVLSIQKRTRDTQMHQWQLSEQCDGDNYKLVLTRGPGNQFVFCHLSTTDPEFDSNLVVARIEANERLITLNRRLTK